MSELVRDGVRLWYAASGAGEPPLLFVHGWCCDHSYFAPQLDHFARTHRVLAVDLRGHGKSDKPEQDYTIGGFADDLAAITRSLQLGRVVLIGHSMGAIAILDAAGRYPGLVAAAVLVEPSPIVVPPALHAPVAAFVEALKGPAYTEAARQHVKEVLFLPSDDPSRRERVAAEISAAPQHVMASAMEHIFLWDGEEAACACTVPVLLIAAANQFGDVDRFARLCGTATIEQIEDVGHFVQLLAPDRVNAMIEHFLHAHDLA
jgi:pimeloyl-ACP methyl ester carboxylesterase